MRLEAPRNDASAEIAGAGMETFVTFVMCGSTMSLPASVIRFVVPLVSVNAVPGAPPFVFGTARLRGESIPVLDVTVRFGLPPTELTEKSHMVVVHAGDRSAALVSDDLPGILAVQQDEVQTGSDGLLPPGMEHWERFLAGSITIDTKPVPILALEQLLDPDEEDMVDLSVVTAALNEAMEADEFDSGPGDKE